MIDSDYMYMLRGNNYNKEDNRFILNSDTSEIRKIAADVIDKNIHLFYAALANFMITNANYFIYICTTLQVNKDFWLYLPENVLNDLLIKSFRYVYKDDTITSIDQVNGRYIYDKEMNSVQFELIHNEILGGIIKIYFEFFDNVIIKECVKRILLSIYGDRIKSTNIYIENLNDVYYTYIILSPDIDIFTYAITNYVKIIRSVSYHYYNVYSSDNHLSEPNDVYQLNMNTFKNLKSEMTFETHNKLQYDIFRALYNHIRCIEVELDNTKELLILKHTKDYANCSNRLRYMFKRINDHIPFTIQDISQYTDIKNVWWYNYYKDYLNKTAIWNRDKNNIQIFDEDSIAYLYDEQKTAIPLMISYKFLQYMKEHNVLNKTIDLDYLRSKITNFDSNRYIKINKVEIRSIDFFQTNTDFAILNSKNDVQICIKIGIYYTDSRYKMIENEDDRTVDCVYTIYPYITEVTDELINNSHASVTLFVPNKHNYVNKLTLNDPQGCYINSDTPQWNLYLQNVINTTIKMIMETILPYKNKIIEMIDDIESDLAKIMSNQHKIYYNGDYNNFITEIRYFYNLFAASSDKLFNVIAINFEDDDNQCMIFSNQICNIRINI